MTRRRGGWCLGVSTDWNVLPRRDGHPLGVARQDDLWGAPRASATIEGVARRLQVVGYRGQEEDSSRTRRGLPQPKGPFRHLPDGARW
jgi:hypothetical protein